MIFELSALAVLGLGFVLGLKHATDADHVVAVTTFLSEENTIWRSLWIGLFWGVGHTLSLAAAGFLVVFLKLSISEWLAARLELVVAGMLIFLGIRVILRRHRHGVRLHKHDHVHSSASGAKAHTHWHLHAVQRGNHTHEHRSWSHFGLRPLVVGVIHGAAGSAALMLLILSGIPSPWMAFLYIFVFGAGSVIGMLAISAVLAAPLYWIHGYSSAVFSNVQLIAGCCSCGFGMYLAWTLLFLR
jgi:ABC-type nickel/cobalt efflux system permease component RcnA